MSDSTRLTIAEAAPLLGLSARQLRYAVKCGAPVIKNGSRGRGNPTLLDPEAIRQWMGNATQEPPEAANKQLADDVVRDIADAIVNDFRLTSGPDKLKSVADRLRDFFASANAVTRRLGLGDLEPKDVPANIVQMTKLLSFGIDR